MDGTWAACMSDHANAAQAVGVQLAKRDTDILDDLIPGWRDLKRAEFAAQLKKACDFTCGQHKVELIGNMMRTTIKELDSTGIFGSALPSTMQALNAASSASTGSLADRVIYMIYKWLSPRTDSEKGRGVDIDGWLTEHGRPKLDIVKQKGSRYDVTYRNAHGIFVSIPDILEYLQERQKTNGTISKTELAILAALQDPYVCRVICAMGIVGREIIGPAHIAVKQTASALEMTPKWDRLLANLSDWRDDPSVLLDGGGLLLFPAEVEEQRRRRSKTDKNVAKWTPQQRGEALTTHANSDDNVINILFLLCAAGYEELKKHMPEDVEKQPAATRRALATSLPTNDPVESMFGKLTVAARNAPAATSPYLEGVTMLKRNDVAGHLTGNIDWEATRKATRERMACTPTRQKEDAAIHRQLFQQETQEAKAKSERASKRARHAAELETAAGGRLAPTADIDELSWHEVLQQCRIRNAVPHPEHLQRGKPAIGKATKAGDSKRRMELRRVFDLELQKIS